MLRSVAALLIAVPSGFLSSIRTFRRVLAQPSVLPVVVSSLVARLPKGRMPLATVLLLHRSTGSFAAAGLVAGVISLSDAASAPAQRRLVDRYGLGQVLIPVMTVHVLAVGTLVTLAVSDAPLAGLVVAASIAGIGNPPASGSIRAIWPRLVSEAELPTGFALESLVQQVVFLSGPLLVGVLAAIGGPTLALRVTAMMLATGVVWFVLATPTSRSAGGEVFRRRRGALRETAVRVLVGGTVLQGIAFGAIAVGVAAVTAVGGWIRGRLSGGWRAPV